MTGINPTKCKLLACYVKGIDASIMTQGITVYESTCKPYLTATITIVDNLNRLSQAGVARQDQVDFAFEAVDAAESKVYSQTMYILTIDPAIAETKPPTVPYTITCASVSYFNDASSIVQMGHNGATGSGDCQRIHSQYVDPSKGLEVKGSSSILATSQNPSQTENKHPFKAINDIIKKVVWSGLGTAAYFADANHYVLSPPSTLFDEMGSQEHFTQTITGGSDWRNTFELVRCIIAVQSVVDANTAPAAEKGGKQSLNIFGLQEGKELIKQTTGGGQFHLGPIGSQMHNATLDTLRQPLSAFGPIKAIQDHDYLARIAASPNYLAKVPINTGIKVTVGKGVTLTLLNTDGSQFTENYLVADLMHTCYFDERLVQGTTTMRCVGKP
jgi:hypothetical protein